MSEATKKLTTQSLDEAIEAAYWQFDAMRKGLNEWKQTPKAERDAFKLVCWGLAKGVFPVPSEIIRAVNTFDQAREALKGLSSEVAMMLGMQEEELRDLFGHANVGCLKERLDQAKNALAAMEATS